MYTYLAGLLRMDHRVDLMQCGLFAIPIVIEHEMRS